MPTTRAFRRRNWHRYPDTIQRLIDGEPIPETEEARGHLIAVYYFHRHNELGEEVIARAGEILAVWREQREGRA